MLAQIRKWGNSLGVVIPYTITKELELEDGQNVKIDINNDKLFISKVDIKIEEK